MKGKVESKTTLYVLCLEDDLQDAELIKETLVNVDYLVNMDIAGGQKEYVDFLKDNNYDIILADNSLPGFDALAALKMAFTLKPEIPFICVSGIIGEEKAVELIKLGASDCVIKDRLCRLAISVQHALKEKERQEERKKSDKTVQDIIDNNPMSIQILDTGGFTLKVNQAFMLLFGSIPPSDYSMFNDIQLEEKGFGELIDHIKNGEVVHFPDMPYNPHDSVPEMPDVPIWVRTTVFPLVDGKGKPEKFVFMHENITESRLAEEEIKKTQLLLSSSLDSQKDTIIFSIDKDYNYLTFNKAHSDAMKYAWNTEIKSGMNILDCITSADDRLFAKKNYDRALNGESHSTLQLFGDVNPAYYESFFNPILDDKNEIIGCTGLARNITQRMLAEQELKNSYIFNETLLKTIPFGMDIVDETGTVLFQSDSFFRIFGKDAIGKKCWNLYRDDKKQCSDCPLFKGITIGQTETYESHGVIGNRIFDISHTGMMYDGKKAMLEIFQDITERKQAEEELKTWNLRFTKLSLNAPGLIYQFTRRLDGTYYVPIASEGIKEIFGCSPKDVLQDFSPIAKVIFPDDFNRVIAEIEYSAEHLSFFTCEFRVQIEGKSIQWIYSKSKPEKLADGTTTWYGFNSDITERKRNELELIIAKEKAEESDRLKSAFLTNMSHEIRTPMNGILGFTELLKEPNLTSDVQQDFIQTIQISGDRMLNTINSIVDMSKIESGLMNLDIQETNLNEKTEFTYKFFKPEVERKGLKFFVKNGLDTEDAVIKTDNEKVYGVLTNLIKNAVKFTYEGSIEFGYVLKSNSEPAELEFYVKDTGVGIPKNQQQTIFERFRQGSNDLNRLYEGSGLGLTIAKSYIGMLGGKIWVESEEGKGSTFYFTIPYHFGEEENTEIKNVVPAELKEIQMKNLKILIVEDDEISYSLLTKMLQKISKEVLHAITGVQAVEACRNNPDLDLVLMDIRMPQMNGLDATQQIRQFNKNVIIIAQTAYGFSGDYEKAIEAGCNDYITKPINKTSLNDLIKKYVNKIK